MVNKKPQIQIVKKRSGRFAVKKRGGGYINGKEKIIVLVENKFIKTAIPKDDHAPKKSEPVQEAAPKQAKKPEKTEQPEAKEN